jgi:hypothetical protein
MPAEKPIEELRYMWKTYEAIFVLINACTKEIRERFERSKKNLETYSSEQIAQAIVDLRKQINGLKSLYGVKADDRLLHYVANIVLSVSGNNVAIIPKYIIQEVFSDYEKAYKGFNKLPDHVRIAIDPGTFRTKVGSVELYQAEAALFEDVCALNNLLYTTKGAISKLEVKQHQAIVRSLIDACFRFLEAFLNGLAFDFLGKNQKTPEDRDIEILHEWDYKNDRARYVSFRDKLVKYPRIVGGHAASPLTEENCPAIRDLVEKSKVFRDAIVHHSPFIGPNEFIAEKDRAFYSVSMKDAVETVSSVLSYLFEVQKILGRTLDDLWWYCPPTAEGVFPERAFG